MSGWDDTSWTTRVVSGAVAVTANDYFVSFQSLSAPSSATLPAANQVVPGREYVIQKDASAQTVTISSTSLVDGSSVALPAGSVAGVRVFSDGTTWWSSAKFGVGGSGGSAIVPVVGTIETGNVTMPNVGSTWTPVVGIEMAPLPAAVGDYVTFTPSFMWQPGASKFLELAVISGSTIVRFGSTEDGTPSTAGEGDPALYPGLSTFGTSGAHMNFVVTSGDLDSGHIRFIVAHVGTGTTSVVYASANYPFRYALENHGAVA